MRKWLVAAVALVTVAASLTGCGGSSSSSSAPASGAAKSEAPAAPAKKSSKLTMEQYNKLETGISYKQAVEILGSEGKELSSNELAGIKTIMYMWQNPDGSNMNAMFQNDKMVSKAQLGLK